MPTTALPLPLLLQLLLLLLPFLPLLLLLPLLRRLRLLRLLLLLLLLAAGSFHVAPGGLQILGSIGIVRLASQGCLEVLDCCCQLALVCECSAPCSQCVAAVRVELEGFVITPHGFLVVACSKGGMQQGCDRVWFV
jgi:hypothetical protein